MSAATVQCEFYLEFGNNVPTREEFARWFESLPQCYRDELKEEFRQGGGIFGDTLLVKLSEYLS